MNCDSELQELSPSQLTRIPLTGHPDASDTPTNHTKENQKGIDVFEPASRPARRTPPHERTKMSTFLKKLKRKLIFSSQPADQPEGPPHTKERKWAHFERNLKGNWPFRASRPASQKDQNKKTQRNPKTKSLGRTDFQHPGEVRTFPGSGQSHITWSMTSLFKKTVIHFGINELK